MLKIIDISNWQGDVNFSSVSKTQDGVIIKASEGVGYKDPRLEQYRSELRKLGMLRGYYHFARPDLGNSAVAEADWFLTVLGTLQSGEVLALDFEVNVSNSVSWVKTFLERISERLEGYKPLVYMDMFRVKSSDWSSVVSGNYGLWLAYWDYDPNGTFDVPHWNTVAMRQYSNQGQVNGISGRVDMNVFYGDKEQFLAYGLKIGDIPCEKLKLENQELKSELTATITQKDGLQDSLNDLNKLYKKLLEDGKVNSSRIEKLVEANSVLTDNLKIESNKVYEKDQKILELEDKIKKLSDDNTRLKLQKFTTLEALTFFFRSLGGGNA